MAEITVGDLVVEPRLGMKLQRLAGEAGLGRPIRHPRIQKSGLALAGHYFGVVPTRIQVLGETELSFLESMDLDARGVAARGFFSLGLSCVVVTRRGEIPRALIQAAEATGTPLFQSDARSSRTINELHAFLDEKLAPTTSLHGVLVDVFGIGLLLLGKSGIGKSECAVELVLRGHRLVADDVVRCEWRPPGMVFGAPADVLRHHVEVRGLGVLNIKDLFGVTAIRERKRIDMVVQLDEWDEKKEYDRLGVDDRFLEILNTPIRLVIVPVRPGRDMGAMLEMAARDELLRRAGKHSARELLSRLEENAGLAPQVAIEDQPESIVRAPVSVSVAPPAPNSSVARPDPAQGWHDSDSRQPAASVHESGPPGRLGIREGASHESSAWIPAVRPKGKE
ncbi:HPr kinase/phosphorylase [Labilithrix luteola]|uniref:HPr kinase/phosphorylase n=2 Tax=Labilithrix luteola TaxID=1391654 RepID=A0A0K1QA30_9BACT|nr:HPr kinase/phosphorylase [Labilithrix luteola]